MTSIEWTDETWNPIKGCSRVSPGCDNCYAISMAHRFSWGDGLTRIRKKDGKVDWTGVTRFYPGELDKPLHWRRPRRVFVCSGADLFHPNVSFRNIARIFGVMASADWHVFQVLTKRIDRALEFLEWAADGFAPWPLPNVWLGVSVEDQERAEERIPVLIECPAAVRFISAEPLLGEVRLDRLPSVDGLHWVIIGGESGPGARDCDLGWVSTLCTFCERNRIAYFVKQLGRKPCTYSKSGQRRAVVLASKKGNDVSEWPGPLQIRTRNFP